MMNLFPASYQFGVCKFALSSKLQHHCLGVILLIIIYLYIFFLNIADAGAEQKPDLLDILLENGTITKEQFNELRERSVDMIDDEEPPVDMNVKTEGDIQVSSYDGNFSFELGGRILADTAFYEEDKNTLGNGTELRQARIELEGTLFADWEYEFEVEFGDGEVDIKDAYIDYKSYLPIEFRIGQFKPPFSLEEASTRKRITFMERALPNEFVPDRKIGLGASMYGELWTAAAGIFGENFSEDPDDEGDEGWTSAARFTFVPFHSETRVIHFGVSLAHQAPDDENKVKFNARPESHITDIKYVNTSKIDEVDNITKYGLEALFLYGPYSLQGEYLCTDVRRYDDEEDVDFDGWYVYGSWFITGESRNYKFKRGKFKRITPHRKAGALELAMRYSTIDLNDVPVVQGGEEENITIGLNWYINPNIRLMANYIMVDNDEFADDDEDLIGNDDINIFQARFQIDF